MRPFETREFRQSEPGGIEELHDGLVADGQRRLIGYIEQSSNGVGIQRGGQMARAFGRSYAGAGILLHVALTQQPAEESADGGKHALQGFAAQSLPMPARNERPYMVFADPGRIADVLGDQEVTKCREIAAVSLDRARRQPALVPQIGGKPVKVGLHARGSWRAANEAQAERRCLLGSASSSRRVMTVASRSRNKVPMPG